MTSRPIVLATAMSMAVGLSLVAALSGDAATRASLSARAEALPDPAVRAAQGASPARAGMREINVGSYPPPPPPPPVPGAGDIHWVYAETSYAASGQTPTPVKVKDVRPVYAPMLIRIGLEGTVILDASIDARGRVARVWVQEPVTLLTQSAIDAVRQWRFDPATVAGNGAVVITVKASYVPPR